jgi:hypothetical protein
MPVPIEHLKSKLINQSYITLQAKKNVYAIQAFTPTKISPDKILSDTIFTKKVTEVYCNMVTLYGHPHLQNPL